MIYVDVMLPRPDLTGWQKERIEIRNDRTGDQSTGNYDVRYCDDGKHERDTRVNDFDRTRGAYALIKEAIDVLGLAEIGQSTPQGAAQCASAPKDIPIVVTNMSPPNTFALVGKRHAVVSNLDTGEITEVSP